MISVVTYGRNDNYGYNLAKRAAISFNAIAAVLDREDDEIIFVDCNTPDDMPTFPEAIRDTLTPEATRLLRVLRVRPVLYGRYKGGSPLPALEPLCRNVAIRRSNPANRWILSTNTDMVFVVREPSMSLSAVAASVPGGFYELPRFEVPEALWESLDRRDGHGAVAACRLWGRSLHLNEAVIGLPENRFDGPGDFQLMLRDQLFEVNGFNEAMRMGWHVDSNIAKRLNLLNGETSSLLDHVFAYHCDHTQQVTFLHSRHRTSNSGELFVHRVRTPFLPEQEGRWGMAGEEIEEIRLAVGREDWAGGVSQAGGVSPCKRREPSPAEGGLPGRTTLEPESRAVEEMEAEPGPAARPGRALEVVLVDLLPGMTVPYTTEWYLPESFDHGQLYDTHHAFPFLASYLSNMERSIAIGYAGANLVLLSLLCSFLDRMGFDGKVRVLGDVLPAGYEGRLPAGCVVAEGDDGWSREADVLVLDVFAGHLPSGTHEYRAKAPDGAGVGRGGEVWSIPLLSPGEDLEEFQGKLREAFRRAVKSEHERARATRRRVRSRIPGRIRDRSEGAGAPGKTFVLIGSQHTWMEGPSSSWLDMTLTPYCSHIRFGRVRSDHDTLARILRGDSDEVRRETVDRVMSALYDYGLRHREPIKKVPALAPALKYGYLVVDWVRVKARERGQG